MAHEQTESVNNTDYAAFDLDGAAHRIADQEIREALADRMISWFTIEELSAQTGLSPEDINRQFDRAMTIRTAQTLYPDFPVSSQTEQDTNNADSRE